MSECTHDCSSCSQNCESRAEDFIKQPHKDSHIKKVIGVVSGKGGVGKSLVTGLLASKLSRMGYSVAVLDADVTGPSVPKMFGITQKAYGNDDGLLPVESLNGVKVMSANLLLEDGTDPVLWRGPIIAGLVEQFWTECVWGDVDYMFVDMPPGTGDVALTVFQTIKLDGIIVVTSPQDLVSMIVEKAVKMANMMNVKILGLVENFAYVDCPDCGKRIYPFGKGKTEKIAEHYGLPLLAQLPIDSKIAQAVDDGKIEAVSCDEINGVAEMLSKIK